MSLEKTLERIADSLEEHNSILKNNMLAPVEKKKKKKKTAPVEAVKEEPKKTEEKSSDKIPYDKVFKCIKELLGEDQSGKAEVVDLLAEFGVKSGKNLEEEQYGEFISKAEALIAAKS